jgi:hypothetical protein
MMKAIDGTKVPHHGLFYMENAGGLPVEQESPAPIARNVSQAASLWKMKKVKIGRAQAPPDRKLLTYGPACECRSALDETYVRFGSKADMCSALTYVRFVPKADIETPLFGQLIGCFTVRHRDLSAPWQAQFRRFLEPGGKRSIRRMCSHL